MRWGAIGLFAVSALLPIDLRAQSFTCGIGQQAACLDYGDKVCTRYGKCVDEDASCFAPYTCGISNKFVCKSDLDDCAQSHDTLMRDYETLLRTARETQDAHNEIVRKYNALVEEMREMNEAQDDLKTCVRSAFDLSEAKDCLF